MSPHSRHLSYEMQIPAVFSIVASFGMIVSYILFKKIRSIPYFQIIFYVALNDFLASIGMAMGVVESGSAACWFQGIVTNYNYLVSIFWTTVLTYDLTRTIRMEQGIKEFRYMHIVCWGLPLLSTLLPLTTNTYSNPENSGWCFIGNRKDSPSWGLTFWVIFSFYIWIWICIALVTYFCIVMLIHSYRAQHYHNRELISTILTLSSYPILLIVCWTITSIEDVNSTLSTPKDSLVQNTFSALGLMLPSLQGFLHSGIFVLRNRVLRNCWSEFFREGKYRDCFDVRTWRIADFDHEKRELSESPLRLSYSMSDSEIELTGTTTFNILQQHHVQEDTS